MTLIDFENEQKFIDRIKKSFERIKKYNCKKKIYIIYF